MRRAIIMCRSAEPQSAFGPILPCWRAAQANASGFPHVYSLGVTGPRPNRLPGMASPLLRHNLASSFSSTLPLSEPLQYELAQSGAGAGGIVRKRVGPRLDPTGERTRNASLLHRGVEAGEFGVAAVEI